MSQASDSKNLFSKLFSVVTLITASLFFVGWIYRWAYYGYFQVDIESLSLSPQSFIILPIQVFFGTWISILQTIALIAGISVIIYFVIWLLRSAETPIEDQLAVGEIHPLVVPPRRRRLPLHRFRDRLRASNPLRFGVFTWLESFLNEVVAIGIILICLFWFAQYRGNVDAKRDAYHCTSTLPAVTVILPSEKNVLGRQFNDLDTLASPERQAAFSIIGDLSLFEALQQESLNDEPPEAIPKIWRLLVKGGGWLYVFQPVDRGDASESLHPAVLGIRESFGDQMVILRPRDPGAECRGFRS